MWETGSLINRHVENVERLSTKIVEKFLADLFVENSGFAISKSIMGTRKSSDFYTILKGCPQIWPIYPLYFSSSPVL